MPEEVFRVAAFTVSGLTPSPGLVMNAMVRSALREPQPIADNGFEQSPPNSWKPASKGVHRGS